MPDPILISEIIGSLWPLEDTAYGFDAVYYQYPTALYAEQDIPAVGYYISPQGLLVPSSLEVPGGVIAVDRALLPNGGMEPWPKRVKISVEILG